MPEIAWIMLSLGVLVLCALAGVSLVIKALASRKPQPVRSQEPVAAPPSTTPLEDMNTHFAKRLDSLQNARFGPEMGGMSGDFEPREPPGDNKTIPSGPHRRRRGLDIRRTAKKRRYYSRRQDPEMFGRREPGYNPPTDDKQEKGKRKKEDGTT